MEPRKMTKEKWRDLGRIQIRKDAIVFHFKEMGWGREAIFHYWRK